MSYTEKALETARNAFEDLEKTNVNYDEHSIDFIIRTKIKFPLESIGKTVAALDPSSESTVKQIENRLQQAKIRIQIRSARQDFSDFETTTANYDEGSIAFIQKEIKRRLADAGEELSVLDPSGKSTNAQIEDRFQQAADRIRLGNDPVRRRHLEAARRLFDGIKSTTTGDFIALDETTLRKRLADAHLTLSALDPTGQSTDQQMQERLDKAVARGQLLHARLLFDRIVSSTTGDGIAYDELLLRTELADAHLALSALDPTGQNTNQQMQERLDKAVARGQLLHARLLFDRIVSSTTGDGIAYDELLLRKGLADAHLTLSVLDPTGWSTDRQMQERLDKAVARGHALKAIDNIAQATPRALEDAKGHLSAVINYLDATGPFNTAAKMESLREILDKTILRQNNPPLRQDNLLNMKKYRKDW